jgi:hypothetical protein
MRMAIASHAASSGVYMSVVLLDRVSRIQIVPSVVFLLHIASGYALRLPCSKN